MKNKLIFTILGVMSLHIYGQGLTGTATGDNSVMIGANNININITDPSINISLNNLESSIPNDLESVNKKRFTYIYGLTATGKNESKFADIFSKGNLASSAKGNVFFGISMLPDRKKYIEYYKQLEGIAKERFNEESIIEQKYIKTIKFYLEEKRSDHITDYEKIFLTNLIKLLDTKDFKENIITEYISKSNVSEDFKREISERLQAIKSGKNTELQNSGEALNINMQKLTEDFINKPYQQLKVFAFGGINALEFKRFVGWNDSNLSDSFADEYFRGGNIGVGANYQRGNWLLGMSYQYLKTNNFALLSSKDYVSKVTQSQNNQSVTQEKKITAYSGKYDSFRINQFVTDLIYNISLDNSKNYFVLINPYVNAQIFSGNKDIFPDNFNVGSGFYLFNSKKKFLGGFYTQINDIGNKFEKLKPIDEQNLIPAYKRVTFGLFATYSFNSIFPEKKF